MVNKKSNELQKIKNYTSCKISFDGDCIILKYYAPSGGGGAHWKYEILLNEHLNFY